MRRARASSAAFLWLDGGSRLLGPRSVSRRRARPAVAPICGRDRASEGGEADAGCWFVRVAVRGSWELELLIC